MKRQLILKNRVWKSIILLGSILVCFLMLFGKNMRVKAAAPKVVVKVGVEECEGLYMEELERSNSYFNKYLTKIYRTMDKTQTYRFEFIIGNIGQLVGMLNAGEVDIVIGESNWQVSGGEKHFLNQQILSKVNVADAPFSIDSKKIFVREDNREIRYDDLQQLNDKVIAAKNYGSMYEMIKEYCKINNIHASVEMYSDYTEMTDDLEQGVVDAVVTNYYIPMLKKTIGTVGFSEKSIMLREDDQELLEKINRANIKISMENPNYRSELAAGYQNNITYEAFDKKEMEFINNSQPIKVVSEVGRVPAEYYDEKTKTFKGIHTDILREIEKYSGLKFEFVGVDNYQAALNMVKIGEADVILTVYDTEKIRTENSLLISQPYLFDNAYMIVDYNNTASPSIGGISKRGKEYGTIDILEKQNSNQYKYKVYEDNKKLLKALEEREIDFAVLDEELIAYVFAEKSYPNMGVKKTLATDIPICFGISTKSAVNSNILIEVLNESIRQITEEERNIIKTSNIVTNVPSFSVDKFINDNIILVLVGISLVLGVPFGIALYNYVRNLSRKYRDYLFEIIAENIHNVVLIYDVEKHRMEYVFNNVERILGISKRICMKNPLSLFINCQDKEVVYTAENGKTWFENVELKTECGYINPKTKEEMTIEIVAKSTTDIHQKQRYIITITDLTDERNVRKFLEDALDTAEQANKAKSEFLSHVSHEIRTPMNAIIGMTEMADSNIDDRERIEDCHKKILASSKHLLNLINDILDMSKIDSGKMAIAAKPLIFTELIKNVVSIMQPQMAAKNIDFRVEITDIIYDNLIGDEMRLEQIALNILSNAAKFTPEDGTVIMQVREIIQSSDDMVMTEFIVTDNGIGISEEFQKHIFEPFEQENSDAAKNAKGTGLGMSITDRLVQLMSGNIEVESEVGKGSQFRVQIMLPINKKKKGAGKRKTSDSNKEKSLEGKRFLLVEDNELNSEIAAFIMDGMKIQVDTAENGEQALEKFRQSADGYYDLILMDIQMPKMNGYEATKAIRELSRTDAVTIPIVAMTANAFSTDVAEAIISGMTGHIPKPVDRAILYQTIMQQMNME